MKKLSKLHLRSEQYLTDSEMKLISGGVSNDEYVDCYKEGAGRCGLSTNRCTENIPVQGGDPTHYTIKTGICTIRYTQYIPSVLECYCDISR